MSSSSKIQINNIPGWNAKLSWLLFCVQPLTISRGNSISPILSLYRITENYNSIYKQAVHIVHMFVQQKWRHIPVGWRLCRIDKLISQAFSNSFDIPESSFTSSSDPHFNTNWRLLLTINELPENLSSNTSKRILSIYCSEDCDNTSHQSQKLTMLFGWTTYPKELPCFTCMMTLKQHMSLGFLLLTANRTLNFGSAVSPAESGLIGHNIPNKFP